MTEYKFLSCSVFTKEASLLEALNKEVRNSWKAISIGYESGGSISKAVLERINNNQ